MLVRDGASLRDGFEQSPTLYFRHSYVLVPEEQTIVSCSCTYGVEFAASMESGNVYATEYHPEKSQRAGLCILPNSLEHR